MLERAPYLIPLPPTCGKLRFFTAATTPHVGPGSVFWNLIYLLGVSHVQTSVPPSCPQLIVTQYSDTANRSTGVYFINVT